MAIRCPERAPSTTSQVRAHSMARLHLAISSCEDFLAQACRFRNVEAGLRLAILFERSADGNERSVVMGWIAGFVEKGEMGQGKFFLGLRPKEWRVLAGPFLHRLMKGGDGFLQPGRPLLALAEHHKRCAQIGLCKSPVQRRAVAWLFRQRTAIGSDRLLQARRSRLALSKRSQCIAQIDLGLGPVERHAFTGVFLQRLTKSANRLLEARYSAFSLTEKLEYGPKVVLGPGPV